VAETTDCKHYEITRERMSANKLNTETELIIIPDLNSILILKAQQIIRITPKASSIFSLLNKYSS
jgi:hypothetical protein